MAALAGAPGLQARSSSSLRLRASPSTAGKASLAVGQRPKLSQRKQQHQQQRRCLTVRAAGFEGPERAEPDTVVIKTLTAPSSWPGAESPIGPGTPCACPGYAPAVRLSLRSREFPHSPHEWSLLSPLSPEGVWILAAWHSLAHFASGRLCNWAALASTRRCATRLRCDPGMLRLLRCSRCEAGGGFFLPFLPSCRSR